MQETSLSGQFRASGEVFLGEALVIAFFVAAALSVLVHELGHATAQRLSGLPVERIVWGAGRICCELAHSSFG